MSEELRSHIHSVLFSLFIGLFAGLGAGIGLNRLLDYLRDNRAYIMSIGAVGNSSLAEANTAGPVIVGLLIGTAFALLAYLIQRRGCVRCRATETGA